MRRMSVRRGRRKRPRGDGALEAEAGGTAAAAVVVGTPTAVAGGKRKGAGGEGGRAKEGTKG